MVTKKKKEKKVSKLDKLYKIVVEGNGRPSLVELQRCDGKEIEGLKEEIATNNLLWLGRLEMYQKANQTDHGKIEDMIKALTTLMTPTMKFTGWVKKLIDVGSGLVFFCKVLTATVVPIAVVWFGFLAFKYHGIKGMLEYFAGVAK